MIVGLTGRMGAGKDTVCERIQKLTGRPVYHASFARPLKQSVAALFAITVEDVELWKNSERSFIVGSGLGSAKHTDGGCPFKRYGEMTMREVLQRYGTEAHRGVFGDDFWVEQAMREVATPHARGDLVVFTDVRFDNEVDAIHDRGGVVYEVVGLQGPMSPQAFHVSERPPHQIDGEIMNTQRADRFEDLDRELDRILMGLGA